MSTHLPECIYTPEKFDPEQNIVWGGKPCICDQLRACERRVEQMTVKAMAPFLITKKEELILINYQSGYRTALLDAREAVAALPKEDGGYCHVLHACDVEAVLDDLRGRQK